jgi:hypothetical protein
MIVVKHLLQNNIGGVTMEQQDKVDCTCNSEPFNNCPKCGTELRYFSGLGVIPSFVFCPKCNDVAYTDDGKRLFDLE